MFGRQSFAAARFALALKLSAFALRMLHGPRAGLGFLLTEESISSSLFLFCFKRRLLDFMDWTLAIEHNQAVLLRNVAWLFTWLKMDVGGSVETMPRLKRLTVLFVLRPSESAYRRVLLVAVLVRQVVAPLLKARPARSTQSERKPSSATGPTRPLPFKLLDTRKPFNLNPDRPKYVSGPGPWVTDLWSDDPIYDRSALYAYQEKMNRAPVGPDDEESAASLCRRMNALMAALQDLDGQVLRMAKLQARIKNQIQKVGKLPLRIMRPGLPPGFRKRQKHEVDEVLAECHRLALMAQHELTPPDTS